MRSRIAETEFPDSRPAIAASAGSAPCLAVPTAQGGRSVAWRPSYLPRMAVQAFSDKQIELVETFADQAVIAIENVRLFESVEARELDESGSIPGRLQTAQDRLVQTEKLASLGQLTAGIAHEIKNPLNFVNNFRAVSVELIDELREALAGAHLDSKLRAEISEIADMLQGNLDKVVQHGKRADTIVKNMLLHRAKAQESTGRSISTPWSRRASTSPITGHGPRKQGFNITVEKSFIWPPVRSIYSRRRLLGYCSI